MRTLFAALAAFLTLVLSAGTVLADTELGHHGKVGVHSLNEADGQVQCNYSSADDSFQSITVAAPNIYARDKTTGVDTQTVGWRIIVKRNSASSPGTFTAVLKSSIFKTQTTDQDPAPFKPRTVTPPFADNVMYLVVVKMLWYKADNTTVAGWAKHRVDRYTEDDGTNHDYPIDGCSDRYLN